MPHHLKMFQWLVYGAVVVQAVETLSEKSWGGFIGFAITAVFVVACAWAAAREGYRFCAWLLVAFFIADIASTIGLFWAGGPSWLHSVLAPDQPATSLVKVLDVVTNLFEVAAIYFYFAGDTRAPEGSQRPV